MKTHSRSSATRLSGSVGSSASPTVRADAAAAVAGASCGDSALLVASGGERPIQATEGQSKNPPVGSGNAMFHPFAVTLVAPWVVLAMSDGVWKYAGWQTIERSASTLHGESLIENLTTAARLPRSGQFQDDFTAVLIESDEFDRR